MISRPFGKKCRTRGKFIGKGENERIKEKRKLK